MNEIFPLKPCQVAEKWRLGVIPPLTTIFVVSLSLFTDVSQWNHTISNETDQLSIASVDVSFCGMVGLFWC